MTMEEKAGLMQITSAVGAGDTPPSDPAAQVVGYINDRHIRYLVLRDNPSAHDLADRSNDYQRIAEATRLGIPVVFTSNPRNHVSGSLEFGITEASGQFSLWPGSLGLATTRDPKLIRSSPIPPGGNGWRPGSARRTDTRSRPPRNRGGGASAALSARARN